MEQRKRPEMLKEFIVDDRGNGIYEITSPPMRFKEYLVVGREKALLIDTGFGLGSLKRVVDGLTDKPLIVINTHGHPDHVGGNAEFGTALLRAEDMELYGSKGSFECRLEEAGHWGIADAAEKLQTTPPAPTLLDSGTVLDLGGRLLLVLHTPGHTMGSVCVFDEESGALFTGDNTNEHGVSLGEDSSSTVEIYLKSLERIRTLGATVLYTGHMPGAVSPEQIDRLIACAERILAGERGEYVKSPMFEGWRVEAEGASIIYREGKLK